MVQNTLGSQQNTQSTLRFSLPMPAIDVSAARFLILQPWLMLAFAIADG